MYRVPSPFTIRTLRNFLEEYANVFQMVGRRMPDTLLVAEDAKFDLVGALVFYKVVEFIIKKNCMLKPRLKGYNGCIGQMNKFGFGNLVSPYFDSRSSGLFTPKYQEFDGVFVAPFILNGDYGREEHQYVPNIARFYNNSTITYAISQCMAEISSNFTEHAMDDTDTVLAASGTRNEFKVVCADTGIGIISSLEPSLQPARPLAREDVLMMAVEKGVTSKKNTNHMGFGLWLVNEFVKSQKGELHIYSEGAYYIHSKGKIKKGNCGYWKGTIIYVSLPLQKLDGIQTVLNSLASMYDDIKINQI